MKRAMRTRRGDLPQMCPKCEASLRDESVPASLVRQGKQGLFSLVLTVTTPKGAMYQCPFCSHRWPR